MAHLSNSATRAENTPAEWLGVGKAVGELANKWSGRYDLVGYVGTNAGHGAPACYNPSLAEIEVDTAIAFGKVITPAMVGDLTDRKQQYDFPKATGAIMHEAFHAKFSQWDLEKAYKALAKDEHEALVLLEESRIEAQGLREMPDALVFLRACAMDIVISDSKEKFASSSNTKSAAFLVATVHARVDAGVLDPYEVSDLMDLVSDYLSVNVVMKLREIARKAQAHTLHSNAEPLYELAKEWAKLVREVAEEKGDTPEEGGEGGEGASSEFIKEMMEALEEAGVRVSIANSDELADQQTDEEWKEEVKSKQDSAKEQNDNKEIASQVFAKNTSESGGKTSSRLTETRKPTAQERIAAVTVAQQLEKAKYRERDQMEITSVTPPGRLRTRALVQGAALKERGVRQQTEAWRRTVRKHTDDPTLKVGIMVDISGSMGSAMNPMATTAWVMSSAVNRIQGECAMVYFGNDVFPVLKSGQKLEQVNVYSAEDGTEKFERAYKALEGSLNLLNGSGARLLVIVSDGCYSGNEPANVRRAMAQCEKAGVAVVWLPFSTSHRANDLGGGYAKVIDDITNPAEASEVIGKACADALTKVGQRAVA